MGLPLRAWDEKIGEKTQCLSGKEKVSGAAVSKKIILIAIWDIKKTISIDFLKKSAAVNNAYSCQLLRKN